MNKRLWRLMLDLALALILCFGGHLLTNYAINSMGGIIPHIGLVALVWFALRYGWASGVLAGALAGIIIGVFDYGIRDWWDVVLLSIIPHLSVGLAGLFAKYTQKTLNNHRYSSTYLNIVTASLMTSLSFYLLRYLAIPLALGNKSELPVNELNFWLSWLTTSALCAVLLIIAGRMNHAFLIPKRTRFLSRKETSSLLND